MAREVKVGSCCHGRGLREEWTFDIGHPYVRFQGLAQGLCRIRQALGCPLGDL